MYVDDTQLYICFNTRDAAYAIAKLVKYMADIQKWMVIYKLQLKGKRTDFVITGSTFLLKKLNISTIKVGDSTVATSPHGKNLWVIFLNMEQQVMWSPDLHDCKIVKFLTSCATELFTYFLPPGWKIVIFCSTV